MTLGNLGMRTSLDSSGANALHFQTGVPHEARASQHSGSGAQESVLGQERAADRARPAPRRCSSFGSPSRRTSPTTGRSRTSSRWDGARRSSWAAAASATSCTTRRAIDLLPGGHLHVVAEAPTQTGTEPCRAANTHRRCCWQVQACTAAAHNRLYKQGRVQIERNAGRNSLPGTGSTL